MNINTNVVSIKTQNSLTQTTREMMTAQQRLSSGLRINSAKDDAAGLSIVSRMDSQLRGTAVAMRNLNDGVSMAQTAEGGLDSINSSLLRIRDLAVQANNATNTLVDRQSIQSEIDQLLDEIENVAVTTKFNGISLLDSGSPQAAAVQAASITGDDADQLAVLEGLVTGWFESSEKMIEDFYGLTGTGDSLTITFANVGDPGSDGAGGSAAYVSALYGASGPAVAGSVNLVIDMADFVPPNLPNGGTAPFYNDRIIAHEMVHAVMAVSTNMAGLNTWFKEGAAEFIHGADERIVNDGGAAVVGAGVIGAPAAWGGTSLDYSAAFAMTRYMHDSIIAAGGNGIKDIFDELKADPSTITLDMAIASVSANLGALNSYNAGSTDFTGAAYTDEATFIAAFNGASGTAYITNEMNLGNADTGSVGGSDAGGGGSLNAEDVVEDPIDNNADPLSYWNEVWPSGYAPVATAAGVPSFVGSIQAGANAGESIDLTFYSARTDDLGITNIDVTVDAEDVIIKIDDAIQSIASQRGEVGAFINRLDATASRLSTSYENLASSQSRIQDADFAVETSNFSRTQVLQQAAMSVLAQANAQPQQVLSLLG